MRNDITSPLDILDKIERSQRYFNKVSLFFYDFILYGFVSRFFWGAKTEALDSHYNNHISDNHLDIGVGTGYLLNRVRFSSVNPRLGLMDISIRCLTKTSSRLRRYQPEIYEANLLYPISINTNKFDSIGINYVMHCVPGDFKDKGIAFQHVQAILNPDGVLFGTTVLSIGVRKNLPAKLFLRFLNKLGVFNNADDTLFELRESLSLYYRDIKVQVTGCTAMFSARGFKDN